MEKVYKTMSMAGIFNLVMGILITVMGGLLGGFMISMGGKLLSRKKEITF